LVRVRVRVCCLGVHYLLFRFRIGEIGSGVMVNVGVRARVRVWVWLRMIKQANVSLFVVEDKTRHDKTRQDKARHTIQDRTRQDEARQN
jgi:hypothetical protein